MHNASRTLYAATVVIPVADKNNGSAVVTVNNLPAGASTCWGILIIKKGVSLQKIAAGPAFQNGVVAGNGPAPTLGGDISWSAIRNPGLPANPKLGPNAITGYFDITITPAQVAAGWRKVLPTPLNMTAIPRNGGVIYDLPSNPPGNFEQSIALANVAASNYDVVGTLGLEQLNQAMQVVGQQIRGTVFKNVTVANPVPPPPPPPPPPTGSS